MRTIPNPVHLDGVFYWVIGLQSCAHNSKATTILSLWITCNAKPTPRKKSAEAPLLSLENPIGPAMYFQRSNCPLSIDQSETVGDRNQ